MATAAYCVTLKGTVLELPVTVVPAPLLYDSVAVLFSVPGAVAAATFTWKLMVPACPAATCASVAE